MIVTLCRDLEQLGLDLKALGEFFSKCDPQIEVRVKAGPCDRPERWLGRSGTPADRLVFGLCAAGEHGELRARARRRGFDPLAIEVVDLGALRALAPAGAAATRAARKLLGAALARARAYQTAGPENFKPVFDANQNVVRRSLFGLPPMRWKVVPSIRREACAAERGCRTCATTCPHTALAHVDGRMVLDKAQCTSCGACVSACPVAAIDLPGASAAQVEAQLRALLVPDDGSSGPGILFHCQRCTPSLDRLPQVEYAVDWFPVELPCLGMVSPAWILQSLGMGAAAVGLFPCRREKCRFGERETLGQRVDYCQTVLQAVGASPDALRMMDTTDETTLADVLRRPLAPTARVSSMDRAGIELRPDRGGVANALLAMVRAHGKMPEQAIEHAGSPLGVVTLRPGCTACGSCASACPSGALVCEHDGTDVAIAFDGTRCIGCGVCAPACPEKVVHVERKTDLAVLAQGRQTLHREQTVRCERCGGMVITRALAGRLQAILGDDPVLPALTRYCETCRALSL
ncbi:MAG: 4Fe-4S binding protein [Burkholderiales bacterium]